MGHLSKRLRIAVLNRDGFRCVYCGRTSAETTLQVDHVLPRAAGGGDLATNLVTACFDCNNGKRDLLIGLPSHVTAAPVQIKRAARPQPVFHSPLPVAWPERCDAAGCSQAPDTVHFSPWVIHPREVYFCCPMHDAGGYWLRLKEWNRGHGYTMRQHIAGKQTGETALALLDFRLTGGAPDMRYWGRTGVLWPGQAWPAWAAEIGA